MVPFIELANGKTYVASEGADLIEPAADGKSLKITWHHWACIESSMGERHKPGVTSVVEFKTEGNKLTRKETLIADHDLLIKKWKVAFPLTGNHVKSENQNTTHLVTGPEGTLAITVKNNWKADSSFLATGDSRLGKGPLRHIPLHLVYEAVNIFLKEGEPQIWETTIELLP